MGGTASDREVSEGSGTTPLFRFSGHQTFPLRIAWIPKAVQEINRGNDPLTNPDDGIQSLGLGKNMVESLRCWIEAFRVAENRDGKWELSEMGQMIFGPVGLDPCLEDPCTPWLLHWLISTNRKAPFWAWECMFNRWPSPEFHASSVLEEFRRQAQQSARPVSEVTFTQHWEVFLHTYRPPRSGKGEDHLDSALAVLGLIREAGERPTPSGKWEPVYCFDTGVKRGIPQQMFAWFLNDWWRNTFPDEQTLPIRDILGGSLGPGRILKMGERELSLRLHELATREPRAYQVVESANLRQFRRLRPLDSVGALRAAYEKPHLLEGTV